MIALRTPGLGAAGLREALREANGQIDGALALLRRRAAKRCAAAMLAWLEKPDEAQLAQDMAWLDRYGHRLWCCTDADFPPLLEHIPQAPAALFVVGNAPLLLQPQVAIIGTRRATQASKSVACDFAQALARAGFVVTSGMAEGIDGAAHAAALNVGAPTIAVVGTGPDRVYPRSHHALAQRIVASGALVSDFPPGTPVRPYHFPRRNRIIAGLSLGTLVIEAGIRSGSLITARQAAEQGREVFAVPGSIHNPQARGCHRLIRDGAQLVETPAELVEVLTPLVRGMGSELAQRLRQVEVPCAAQAASSWQYDGPYQTLLTALGHDPASLDVLCERTGQAAAELSSALLMLELEGLVEGLPGNRYQRLAT